MKRIYFTLLMMSIGWLNATDAVRAARVSREEIAEVRSQLPIQHAIAAVNPTKGYQASGIIIFTAVRDGVRVIAELEGLSPGKHGLNIHEYDCCSEDASSAGQHYNPLRTKHGSPFSAERHMGDLGNVVADLSGHASYDYVDPVIQLNGPYSIIGKSILVHANADDYTTQPSGNTGAGIGFGIISER